MAVTIDKIQIYRPDASNELFTRAYYVMNLPLAKLQEGGAATLANLSSNDLFLQPREYITGARLFIKQALVGAGLTDSNLFIQTVDSGNTLTFQGFNDISDNTVSDGNLFFSAGSESTSSSRDFVTGGTLTTLQDSLSGNCTPNAVTALTQTTLSRVTTVDFNGVPTRFDLTDDQSYINIRLETTGCNLNALTAGDIWIYVTTEQLPTFTV